jgi:replication factor A1
LIIVLGLRVIEQTADKIGDPKQMTDAVIAESNEKPTPAAVLSPASAQSSYQQDHKPSVQASSGTDSKPRGSVFPIEGLSPYQNNWTIKARVTQKSDMKTWSNNRGEGKLFNVTLMDESGEIRGTAFNLVAEDLFKKFEEGKVYYISKARVNLAKKKFSNLNNDYELGFERNTEVEEVIDRFQCVFWLIWVSSVSRHKWPPSHQIQLHSSEYA